MQRRRQMRSTQRWLHNAMTKLREMDSIALLRSDEAIDYLIGLGASEEDLHEHAADLRGLASVIALRLGRLDGDLGLIA